MEEVLEKREEVIKKLDTLLKTVDQILSSTRSIIRILDLENEAANQEKEGQMKFILAVKDDFKEVHKKLDLLTKAL